MQRKFGYVLEQDINNKAYCNNKFNFLVDFYTYLIDNDVVDDNDTRNDNDNMDYNDVIEDNDVKDDNDDMDDNDVMDVVHR